MIGPIPWAAPFQFTEWNCVDGSVQIHYQVAKQQVVKTPRLLPKATVKFLKYI